MATGKSTVARIFQSFGARVIDADSLAHRFIGPKGPAYKKIVGLFGKSILKKGGRINRRKIAGLVFQDPGLLKKLNRIVHPPVIKFIKEKAQEAKEEIVVLDLPLLFEAGLEKFVDKVIVVKASRQAQLKRALQKRRLNKKEILTRIKAQMPLSRKVRLADFVIDNNGTVSKTKKQAVKFLRRQLWKS